MPYKKKASEVKFVGTGSTSFDGTNDYVNVGTDSSLDIGQTGFTVACWLKYTDTGVEDEAIVGIESFTYDYGLTRGDTVGGLGGYRWNGSATKWWYNAGSGLNDGVWHHLVYTFDGTTDLIYIDGINTSFSDGSLTVSGTAENRIGYGGHGGQWYTGSLKNVAIWNRALTATEVQNVMYKTYAEVKDRLASGLVSWWAMDATQVDKTNLFDIDGNWGVDETSHTWLAYGGGTLDASVLGEFKVIAGTISEFEMGGYLYTNSGTMDSLWIAGGNYRLVATTSSSISSATSGLEFYDDGDITQFNNGDISYDFVLTSTSQSFFRFHDMAQLEEITISNWKMYKLNCEDLKGSNDGITYGATIDTDLYGGDTPVIPRAIDNAPTVQADSIGGGSALFVDSNTDFISMGDIFDNTTNAYSITAWIKTDGSGDFKDNVIACKRDGSSVGWKFFLESSTNKVRLFAYDGSTSSDRYGATNIGDGEWHHVAAVSSSANNVITIYVDGVNDAGTASLNTINTIANDGNFTIGVESAGSSDPFDGNICQVGIWKGALTQEKIQSVMEKTFEELTATEKSSLGAELVDNNTTTGWYDNSDGSTISNITNGVSIADDSAYSDIGYFRDSLLLTTDLTIGTLYKVIFDAYHNGTGTPTIRVNDGTVSQTVTISDTNSTYSRYITATSATAAQIRTGDNSSGSIVYITNLSVKAVTHDLVSYWSLDEAEEEGRSPIEANARTETGVQTGAGSIVLDSVNPPTYTEILNPADTTFATQGNWVAYSGTPTFGDTGVYPEGALKIDNAQIVELATSGSGFDTALVTGSLYKIEWVWTVLDGSHVQHLWFGIDDTYGSYGLWDRYQFNTDVYPEAEQTVTFYHRHDGGNKFYFRGGASSIEFHIKSISCKLVSGNQGFLV